jgi:hypothetical protein
LFLYPELFRAISKNNLKLFECKFVRALLILPHGSLPYSNVTSRINRHGCVTVVRFAAGTSAIEVSVGVF